MDCDCSWIFQVCITHLSWHVNKVFTWLTINSFVKLGITSFKTSICLNLQSKNFILNFLLRIQSKIRILIFYFWNKLSCISYTPSKKLRMNRRYFETIIYVIFMNQTPTAVRYLHYRMLIFARFITFDSEM